MSDQLFERALVALPHGAEFRFVDRLTALDPGRSGNGEYRIRGDESFLAGHFPEHPILPGVILIEAAAQLAGIVAQSDPDHRPLADLRLTAVRQAKILGTASPGETLAIAAEITGRLGPLIQAEAEVRSGREILLRTAIVLSGSPGESA